MIGLAVGPEKFTADASEVMEMLLKTQTGDAEMSDDDPQVIQQFILGSTSAYNILSFRKVKSNFIFMPYAALFRCRI